VEVATIGNEGMVDLPLFLGVEPNSGKAFTQVPGDSLRMPAAVFRETDQKAGSLTQTLQLYTQALMVQISQGMACNGSIPFGSDARDGYWMTHDRIGAEHFPLSQEFLALMLGVRRGGVNKVATELKQAGLIQYQSRCDPYPEAQGARGNIHACATESSRGNLTTSRVSQKQ